MYMFIYVLEILVKTIRIRGAQRPEIVVGYIVYEVSLTA